MKKFKFLAMILGLSFGLASIGVNAWTYKPYEILFENWGTQTVNTAYENKETDTPQKWETVAISNGGSPEVVLQGKTEGSISDDVRVWLHAGESYEWKTYLSKIEDHDYRLQFKKNGWTIGMTNVTGFWWKY